MKNPITFNLDGTWRYTIDDDRQFYDPRFDDADWKVISIPSNWFLAGLDHHGVVWFRREFTHRRQRDFASIHFDGVDYFADVYLNGEYIGHHTGYFEPFTFDLTSKVRTGRNLLAIRVDSPYEQPGSNGWFLRKRLIKGVLNHHDCRPGGGWETRGQSYNTGGIWNRVYLEQHGALTISHLLLRAEMDTQPVTLQCELHVTNLGGKIEAPLEIQCEPENFKGASQIKRFSLKIPEGKSIHKFEMPIGEVHLWQPWERGFPHLYKVSAIMIHSNMMTRISSLFGFRRIRVEPNFHWFINGKSFFPRGSNYIPAQWLSETLFEKAADGKEHPFGGVPAADFYPRDIDLARESNLNFMRVHAMVLPHEFYDACDRAGMLVWQDFPLQWGYSDETEFHNEAERQIQAMVTNLYNHPSVAAWCCHNESPWDAPWMAGQVGEIYDPSHNRELDIRLEKAVQELDSSRYVHRNSGTGDGHVYPGWYAGHWRDFHDLPGSPLITEYGAQGLPDKQSILRTFQKLGPDAGFSDIKLLKTWLDAHKKISTIRKNLLKIGTRFYNLVGRMKWKSVQNWMKGWGIKMERSIYGTLPPKNKIPSELQNAYDAWETWRFHDFQPAETFDNGIILGNSLEEFIANSQAYQSQLIQYANECYRQAKYTKVNGVFQFDFIDPWPAVTWSVVDYWRRPKQAYKALRRSMQPVLPCFLLPDKLEAGQAYQIAFSVVNDMVEGFPEASCTWCLSDGMGSIATASFPLVIPVDGVSKQVKITLPSLKPGNYHLSAKIFSNVKMIGENSYDLSVY